MAKVGDVLKGKTVTGQTVDLLDPMTWWRYALGAGFLLLTIAWGQRGAQELNKKLPANLRETIDPITSQPKAAGNFSII